MTDTQQLILFTSESRIIRFPWQSCYHKYVRYDGHLQLSKECISLIQKNTTITTDILYALWFDTSTVPSMTARL